MAWSYVPLEEPLSVRPGVCFSMIWRGDCLEHRPEMGFKLDMAAVRIEHMPQPRVLEKHHSYSLGRCRFSEDGSSCLWAVCQGRWLLRSFAGSGARSQAICLIGPAIAGGSLVVDRARAALYTRFRDSVATRSLQTEASCQNACSRWHTGGLASRNPWFRRGMAVANPSQRPRKPHQQANSNHSPRLKFGARRS